MSLKLNNNLCMFCVCVSSLGSNVPVCTRLKRRLGQHHVPWTGCSGNRPAGTYCRRTVNKTGTILCKYTYV